MKQGFMGLRWGWDLADEWGWGLVVVAVGAVLSLAVSLQVGVFWMLFAVVGWWAWLYEEDAFIFLLVLAPLLPLLKITQSLGTVTLVRDVVILALFGRLVVMPLLLKQLPYRRNVVFAPVAALVLWSLVATLRANSLILGVLRLRDIVLYMLLFMATLYLPHSKELWRRRALWVGASALIVLGLGVWQWVGAKDSAVLRFDPARQIWIPRLSSVLAHPSVFGHYLLLLTSGAAAWLLVAKSFLSRSISILTVFILGGYVFLTYSRAVWIGFVIIFVVLAGLWMSQRAGDYIDVRKLLRRISGLLIFGLVVLLLTARFTPAGPYLASIIDPTYGSNEERINFFVRLVAPITPGQVLIGAGLGDVLAQNFREVDLAVFDVASGAGRAVQLTKNRTLVDNQYLKTFIEMGVVGLVLYGWLYWRLLREAVARFRGEQDLYVRFMAAWMLAWLAAFMVQALFIDVWDIFPTNVYFWVLAGLFSAGTCEILNVYCPKTHA